MLTGLRGQKAVAFTVLRGLGVDSAGYSIPYLTSWSERATAQTLAAIAGLVDRLAGRIEQALTQDPAATAG